MIAILKDEMRWYSHAWPSCISIRYESACRLHTAKECFLVYILTAAPGPVPAVRLRRDMKCRMQPRTPVGVLIVKEDGCHATTDHAMAYYEYGLMRDGLNATGHPIFFSLCGWKHGTRPQNVELQQWLSLKPWRIGPDDTTWGMLENIDLPHLHYAGSGGWNDPCDKK